MIKLSEFKSQLAQLVRPNRFFIEITPPSIYDHGQDLQFFTYLAQSAKIPEKNIGEIEIKYHGMSLKIPGDYTHDDLSITFLNHYGWEPRDFFEGWIEIIQSISSDNSRADSISVLDDAHLIVKQVGDIEEDILASYKFYNIFPKSISEIELNMETYDSVETFTVTFSYSHWVQE